MIKTEFFNDFVAYYKKADLLERRNIGLVHEHLSVMDPLMDSVTIYDTIHRRQAGFSKVLEDIHGKRQRKDLVRLPDFTSSLDSKEFHFLHLFHRFTGSGASFQPRLLPGGSLNPKEHGYCNNRVGDVANHFEIYGHSGAKQYIVECTQPMVTSTGNQPPSIKNPNPAKYRLAQQYYFNEVAESFIDDYLTFLINKEYETNQPTGIKEAVDFCCGWHKQRGFKQWHFVMTAFVMDTAEYYPELVDPSSHCYYGANCIRGFDLMFTPEVNIKRNKADWYEDCMSELCKILNGKPYDMEDVVCDIIRYWSEYIPKGYDHLTQEQRANNSTLKQNGEYPPEIQQRLNEILK